MLKISISIVALCSTYNLLTKYKEVILHSRPALANGTFSDDGNVLSLHCSKSDH